MSSPADERNESAPEEHDATDAPEQPDATDSSEQHDAKAGDAPAGAAAEGEAAGSKTEPPQVEEPPQQSEAEAKGDDAGAGTADGAADGDGAEATEDDARAVEVDARSEEKAEPSVAGDSKSPKAKDVAPGADLDPIAIAPERELTAEERARVEAEAEERASREAEATAGSGEEEPVPAGRETVSLAADARIQATGKRKRSVARVILRSGDGTVSVNNRTLENYFPRDHHRTIARQPLVAAGYESSVDVWVRVHGGGVGGQAGAVRHGIARALCEVDPELRGELKRRGMLTRDAREKERRKAGLKKARKRPQFSKR